ncbi:MAG: hypothetical protein CSYNP_02776 [Syntrophus sp. SKADARSKE-3]|nr:hypothetical protein [Syntrophus sp. SKADARSKE-3]
MDYIYKLAKRQETPPWYEVAEIYQESVSYFIFKKVPICIDGSQEDFNKELIKRGWRSGINGTVYQENIKGQDIIDCLDFGSAFKKVYQRETHRDDDCVDLTMMEFIHRVEEEKRKAENGNSHVMLPLDNSDSIREVLEKRYGFNFVSQNGQIKNENSSIMTQSNLSVNNHPL